MPNFLWLHNLWLPSRGKKPPLLRPQVTKPHRPFCGPRRCRIGGHEVIHEFLYLPDCPVPLMGRDLLAKMGAQVSFSTDGSAQLKLAELPSSLMMALTIRREEEWRLCSSSPQERMVPLELETEYPLVWAEGNPLGLARCHAPILIDLKPGAQPVKLQQYLIPREA